MSNSTPRAALPPLPAPHQHRFPYTEVVQQFYTAEQVEQIRRETVQACADVVKSMIHEESSTAWNACAEDSAYTILALLEPKA